LSESPFLSLRGLEVAYRSGGRSVTALADVSLDLAAGRRLAVIGESGSGKSTLAMAVAGLLPPSARVSGGIGFPTLGAAPRLGRDIGVVFQDPGGSLDPVIAVGRQIAEAIVAHEAVGWREAETRAAALMERVRIPRARERARDFPHEFSGGQRQRIAIAAALAGNPKLLIADEPTSALDTVVQRELVALFDELTRDAGLTLIFVTHDIALASEIADDVAVLHGGRLVETGPAGRVFSAPAHPYTRALLATRLDLDTAVGRRLPEIDPADFSVHIPEPLQ
jgi:peptide/nickel transport system ATP-binding protein